MSEDPKLGPLPGALSALVDAERRTPSAPSADRARVWQALSAKLPPPGGGGGGGGPDGGGGTGPGIGKLAVGGGIAAIGAAVAIVVALRAPTSPTAAPQPPPVRVERAPEPVTPPAPGPAPAPVPAPVPAPAPARVPAPPPAHAVERAPAGEPEDAVIERARIALARSRFDEALKLLSDHEQRFPDGPLRSDRELLIVRALLGTSDRAAAVERAERLRRAHPDDPALPAIDRVLAK